jgi:hypothetical protein
MGIAEGIRAGIELNEAPLRQALMLQELQDRAQKIQQAMRLRDALLNIQQTQQTPAPPQASVLPQRTPDVPPITQQFFGDPESMAQQQAAFLERYAPRTPSSESLLSVVSPASTPTVQATREPTTPAPAGAAPRRATTPGDTTGIQRTIVQESRNRDIDPALGLSLFEVESNFDNTAINPESGAFSIGQFLLSTAKSRGLDVNRLKNDPTYAVQSALDYFKELRDTKGDTNQALWAYGGATRPETRAAYTDKIFSKYRNNLVRAAQLGSGSAVAPAPGVQVADASGDTLTDAQRLSQFAQQYNPSGMQMGPPEAATTQAPTQPLPLPTTGQSTGDTETLRQVGMAHLQHGDARVGALLLQTAKAQRDMQEMGTFLRQILANPGTSSEMRAQAMAGLGELLARSGQTEQALKLLERALPLSERELLSQVTGGTRDILLAQRAAGQPLNIRKALDEEQAQKEAQRKGQDSQVVETADGTFLVDKRTGLATRVTIGSGALGAETPTGTPPTPGTKGKALPGKAMTEPQAKAFGFGSRALAANTIVGQLEDTGVTGAAFGPQLLEKTGKYAREFGGTAGTIIGIVGGAAAGGGVGAIPGATIGGGVGAAFGLGMTLMADTFANLWRTPQEQMYAQARLDFIAAVLRKESGAAISAGEFVTEEKRYFPQPGDSPQVIAQKRQARATALATLSTEAGRPLQLPQPPPRVQTPEEQGIVTVPGSGERVRVAP